MAMRKWVGAAVAAMMVGGAALAQQGERLPAECRQQIVDLCRGAEGGFRQCLRTALPKLSDDCRKAISNRAAGNAKPVEGMRTISYGQDPAQALDLLVPAGGKRPLLLFVHGGGWSIGDKAQGAGVKAEHFAAQGWAFASINYRLVPQATVEGQAADVAAAIAYLRAHADQLGIDGNRIVLMGHSAGAHLVALVGTDTRYLDQAGVPLPAVRGEILLDGAGYNIAEQMRRPGNPVQSMYDAAFGHDPKRQAALSPTSFAQQPNVAAWLILPIERRSDSQAQSRELADALVKAGNWANVTPVPDKSHGGLNKAIGEDGDYATALIDKFLAGLR
jgi:acetyl esterase/lipase